METDDKFLQINKRVCPFIRYLRVYPQYRRCVSTTREYYFFLRLFLLTSDTSSAITAIVTTAAATPRTGNNHMEMVGAVVVVAVMVHIDPDEPENMEDSCALKRIQAYPQSVRLKDVAR